MNLRSFSAKYSRWSRRSVSHFPSRKFEQITFGQLRAAWEPAHLKKAPSFSYLLPRVRTAFDGTKAREVTTAKVQEFLDRLRNEEDLSASSVNHYRTILNSIFNEAVRHGRYDTNPVRAIHQFREPPGRDRFLSVEEFRLLLEKCKDPELRTVILVLCMTTLRLRELLNRRWSEVHLDGPAPFIAVPHTKTGVPKKTPLPRVAAEALKGLPSYGVDDYVFPSRPTAKWPDPKKPYRWTWVSRSGPSFGRWESTTCACTTSGHRTFRAADAGHSGRRRPEDHGPPLTRARALPASFAAVPGADSGPDRSGPPR